MNRKISFSAGEYYHIYNRGVDKRVIFNQKSDYERCIALLYLSNTSKPIDLKRGFDASDPKIFFTKKSDTLVDICAYCLMPNHFHLLIKEKSKDGKGISLYMQKLTTAYSMYFNARNGRSGTLFQGPFQAKHADKDHYLKYLISYIHLNPIKLIDSDWRENGIKDRKKAEHFLDEYAYSSYKDFNGIERSQSTILTKGSLPEYFESPVSFKENIKEWLSFKDFNFLA